MAYHINHGHFPIKPTFCQPWYCAPKNHRNSDSVILGKQLAPGHSFMCIPYIFLNFIFLLITASVGPETLHKPLVISCPNTSLITFTAWVLEPSLPSAIGPKFPMRKAKPDRRVMVAVYGLPGAATAPQPCPAGQSPVVGVVPATHRTFHSQEECKNNTSLLE